jgi:hypothetical protein
MRLDYFNTEPNRKALLYSASFLLIAICAELALILTLNSGHFVFTLDDPYIHLALAEHILHGHYGINRIGYSAPSSSILWPFLLAPFASLRHAEYAPLGINIIAAVGTLTVFWKILSASIRVESLDKRITVLTALLILLTLGTNIIGLIFTGMEHSAQVLFCVFILWGLIYELENGRVPYSLAAAVVIAPLIRYECLALSVAAIVFMLCRRHYQPALITTTLLVVCLGAFSAFLVHLGLKPFPTSVLAKTNVVSGGPYAYSLLIHLKDNLYHNLQGQKGIILTFGLLYLLYQALFSKLAGGKRLLAGVIALAVAMHLMVGKFGMFNRYEMYIWTVTALTMIYVSAGWLSTHLSDTKITISMALAGLVILLTCKPYIYGLMLVPLASNNIYEQQYQMHRFAVEYYRMPVAVNDIGYVSFKNDNYVLDLAGLGSVQALSCREHGCGPDWMNRLAKVYDVRFAMIYSDWFRNIPANWIKVGALQLGKNRVTPAESGVSFYALNNDTFHKTATLLPAFQATLPADVKFVIDNKISAAD